MPRVFAQLRSEPDRPLTSPGLIGPECLDAIRQGNPAAAQVLYGTYASQIRSYLRRHTGIQNVESTVFDILIEAVRSVRGLGAASIDELSQTVRELSVQGVFALLRGRASQKVGKTVARDSERDLVNGLFTVLDHAEREILLRSFLLSENDDEISTELKLPTLQIRRTRAKARVLFRISCQVEEQNVAAPA